MNVALDSTSALQGFQGGFRALLGSVWVQYDHSIRLMHRGGVEKRHDIGMRS